MPTSTMNFSDPATKQLFQNLIEKIYGGQSQQTDDIMNSLGGSGYTNPLANHDFLQSYFQNAATNGDPNMAMYRQQATGAVNKASNQSQTAVNQKLAQSGMYDSGISTNAEIALAGQREASLGNVNTQLAQQDSAYRSQAINGLLGLDNQNLQLSSQQQQQLIAMMGMTTNPVQQQNNSAAWGSIAGSGLTAAGAAIAASDRNLKEHIVEVGKSNEGIPIVEFCYKGSDKRYRGVIAQDVEKVIPEAVQDINGIKHVDYNKISVPFEAL